MTFRKFLLAINIVLCLSILAINPSNSQDLLSKNKKFFKKHLKEYDAWLKESGLTTLIAIDKYEIIDNRLILMLKNSKAYRNPELLAEAWTSTRLKFEDNYNTSLEKVLLQKTAHIMELSPDQVTVNMVGVSPVLFRVSVTYLDGELSVDEVMDEVRGSNNDRLVLKMEDIGFFTGTDTISQTGQLKEVKGLLFKGLSTFFEQSESKFGNDPKVEMIRSAQNEFTLMVSNVSDQIISNYFELINLNIEVSGEEDEFEISYSVFGKYSSGIFIAPRTTSSDYKDMYPEYSAEINLYIDKLGQLISSILKNS